MLIMADNMTSVAPGVTTAYPVSTMTSILSTMDVTNATVGPPCEKSDIPFYWGFICTAISIFFYGTNFAPVKKFDTGDGTFFQWILCIAIWCSGLVVDIIRGSPKFYPLAMLGGVLWETGNMCVVPIIRTIGLGLGLCIWGMTNLLSGWATGRFGFFGLTQEEPDNKVLNDIGVTMAMISAVIFAMVKNEISTAGVDHTVTVETENSPLLTDSDRNGGGVVYTETPRPGLEEVNFQPRTRVVSINQNGNIPVTNEEDNTTFFDRMNPMAKRIFGVSLSLISGLFYGQIFTPAFYIQDNYDGASQEALDYVFATFSGILATSTFYFLLYAALTKNHPKVYPRAILPGFVSGAMWGMATSAWFVANKVLSEAVAFPIISTGPGVLASLLGVLVFKEIQGRRNILILLLGISVTVTGSVLTGLSRKSKAC